VTPTSGQNTPVSLAVFSYTPNGVTVTQAGVPSKLGTNFRAYVEATTGYGQPGSFSTGVAVADTTGSGGSVTFELYGTDGTFTGLTQTTNLPMFGQIAGFLNDIFQNQVSLPFHGILRVVATSQVSVVALRIRYNERNEFLMTTTPPSDELGPTSNAEVDFPHILNGGPAGGNYTTQFILFSGAQGQSSTGNLKFFNHDGTPLSLNLQ
jgi:hypothetical protein